MTNIPYEIYIADSYGRLLAPNTIGQGNTNPNTITSLSITRTTNDIGTLVVTYGKRLDPRLLSIDNLLLVYRMTSAGSRLITDTAWIIRRIRFSLSSDGVETTEITAYSGNYLLTTRGIAYYSGSAQASRNQVFADDMIKSVVAQNIGGSATDAARNVASFVVAGNNSAAGTLSKSFAWRNSVLSVCQEIANDSAINGTYVAFDVTMPTIGTWLLQTFTGQRAIDRRVPGGKSPLLVGPEFGNVAEVEIAYDQTETATFAYALGQDIGVRRQVGSYATSGTAYSQYGRREVMVDARYTPSLSFDFLTGEARAALWERRPKQIMRARILDTPTCRYGIEWSWGDYVTVQAFGQSIDARIDAVSIRVEGGMESIVAWAKTE